MYNYSHLFILLYYSTTHQISSAADCDDDCVIYLCTTLAMQIER